MEPLAPGSLSKCELCGGVVEHGVCLTCAAKYENGQRIPDEYDEAAAAHQPSEPYQPAEDKGVMDTDDKPLIPEKPVIVWWGLQYIGRISDDDAYFVVEMNSKTGKWFWEARNGDRVTASCANELDSHQEAIQDAEHWLVN
jgi:hypothetical protein